MPLVNTKEMFKKAYDGGYAIGAFNVNNMEIVQGIVGRLSGAARSPSSCRFPARRPQIRPVTRTCTIWFRPRWRRPVCPSPCIWIMARTLSSAKTASTAALPPL